MMANDMTQNGLIKIFVLVATLLFSSSAIAEPAAFSKQVTTVTGDWEAEDWKQGRILLHPDKYTWQSDYFMELLVEEPVMGRSARQVLIDSFGVIRREKQTFDTRDAKEIAPGVWMHGGRWIDSYGDSNIGLFGIITTPSGTFILFTSQCQPGKGRQAESDRCIDKISEIMTFLANGSLKMPEPPAPLTIANWQSRYSTSGVSTLSNSNYNNTVTATIRVSPPLSVPADRLQSVIKEFSEGSWDEQFDNPVRSPPSHIWVGSTVDPWIRSTFPDEVMDGVSTIMAGHVKMDDGRVVLLSVRCPNPSWQGTCSQGIEDSKLYIRSGIVERRRQKLIAAFNNPLPANGLKNSDILGVYGEYAVNGTTPYLDTKYFLKNGTAYSGTDEPPAMIDPVRTKQEKPGSWGKWQRVGDKFKITWGDGDTDEVSANPANQLVGGPKGMRLSGYYGSISSSGSLMTQTGFVNRSGYTFYSDGTFTSSSSNMFSVGGFTPDGGAMPVQIVSGGGGSNSGRARYDIDGYMITFYYPDGRISRNSFAIYARDLNNPKRETIYINGSAETLNGGEG
jgi:hypothetical protein